jgi:cellulose synthase/poly-beta-1,6-N-acetylglucosamine synthase-like glycosyltransferase
MTPLVSVVIEAYNEEHNALTLHSDTLDALYRQEFPLERVELVLIGSSHQVGLWKKLHSEWRAFGQVRMLAVDPENSYYWQLKNQGAQAAEGEIVAFIDSDVCPGPQWLSSIVTGLQNGADVVIGPSMYRTPRLAPDSAWMLAAALPSWGFILARTSSRRKPQADSLLGHNVAMRRTLLLEHPFQVFRRSFPSSLLYFELVRSGAKVAFQPAQKVAHGMRFSWWLFRKHFRTGWETYDARSADPAWPRVRALERVKIIEPVVLRMGLVCYDARHWFRYSRVVGVSRIRASLLFPLVMVASFAARSAEMAGMYAALVAPESTEHQARF